VGDGAGQNGSYMNTELAAVTDAEKKAIVGICILAAFADGAQSEVERNAIGKVVENFRGEGLDLTATYQDALGGMQRLSDLAKVVTSPNAKALGYEMAVCVCNADGALNAAERQFLEKLRRELNLDSEAAAGFQDKSARLTASPTDAPPVLGALTNGAEKSETDEMILNRAILTGALELMPQRLATMAIVPIQMRLVYQIGKNHGYELDWGHAKEFLVTVGVGMASQVVEGYVSQLLGSVTKKFAGRIVGALVSQATESAFVFATTYALGHAAKSYYGSGRTMSTEQLQSVFRSMLEKGRAIKGQYAGKIAQQSSTLKVSDFMPLVKERIGP
jgi:uncharacterized protein (DUF697 family)/tellurite resistance protein